MFVHSVDGFLSMIDIRKPYTYSLTVRWNVHSVFARSVFRFITCSAYVKLVKSMNCILTFGSQVCTRLYKATVFDLGQNYCGKSNSVPPKVVSAQFWLQILWMIIWVFLLVFYNFLIFLKVPYSEMKLDKKHDGDIYKPVWAGIIENRAQSPKNHVARFWPHTWIQWLQKTLITSILAKSKILKNAEKQRKLRQPYRLVLYNKSDLCPS